MKYMFQDKEHLDEVESEFNTSWKFQINTRHETNVNDVNLASFVLP